MSTYYERNREVCLASGHQYYLQHREHCLNRQHEYNVKHQDRNNVRYREYYRQHKERLLKRMKEYRCKNKAKRSAEIRAWWHIQIGEKCEKCGSIGNLERHHPNYDRPLETVTLCHTCHARLHLGIMREA